MFSDPLSVTYNGAVKTLARLGRVSRPGVAKTLMTNVYGTADEEFSVYITESNMGGNVRRFEIILERTQLDSDGPFVGNYIPLPNRFGFVYEVNSLKYNTATDVALLRTALSSLVDTTFQTRILGGEK